MQVCILDGRELESKSGIHEVLADTLDFPAWYGGNMDALYDCLTDMREETEIRILHIREMEEKFGGYAGCLLKAVRTAARDNPLIHWKMEES